MKSAYQRWIIRAYRITNEKWTGISISEFERLISNKNIVIQRIRHKDQLLDPNPDTIIQKDDVMVIMAQHGIILDSLFSIATRSLGRRIAKFPTSTFRCYDYE
ncbi:TrkA C-terminal domain-containing protein [Flavobacterium sp. MMS24-S5]|uniref:TrkA C-terminal domain-containing protein n=1 Tax=Flavobacterium sp. MMS24-S5 TaxID=3416605 RepID=UPI003D07CBAC